MQFSRAQNVADGFLEFFNDPWSTSEVMNGVVNAGAGVMLRSLAYVSDWLHVWMLSGEAHGECGNDFGLYTHAVAVTFAAGSQHPSLIENLDLLPLQRATKELEDRIVFVASQEYILPAALTAEFFAQTSSYSREERAAYVTQFLERPEIWRFGYNIHRG